MTQFHSQNNYAYRLVYIHTYTLTHVHTRTRAHAHTRTRAHAHTRTRALLAHVITRTRTHAHRGRGADNIDLYCRIQRQTYRSYEPTDLPTHIFCMEVRLEKNKYMCIGYHQERGKTAQEIRVDGKMMDDMSNFHIGSNRMKRLQHNIILLCCSINV